MLKRVRYYTAEDDIGVTPSRLKRLGKERQKEYIKFWFLGLFEDPAHATPFESAEGGYQYIWGGPYDATEEMDSEFSSIVFDDLIAQAADELQNEEGVYEWAPGHNHPSRQDREREALEDEVPPGLNTTAELERIEEQIRSGYQPSFGDDEEARLRRQLAESIEDLLRILPTQTPEHAGIGHNNPPNEDAIDAGCISDIRTASQEIKSELKETAPDVSEIVNSTLILSRFLPLLKKASQVTWNFATKMIAGEVFKKVTDVAIDHLPGAHDLVERVVDNSIYWLHYVFSMF